MSFKEAIEKELEINSKVRFEEAYKRIDNLKEKTFNNVRTEWKKKQLKITKNKGKKQKKRKNSQVPAINNNNDLDNSLKPIKKLTSDDLEKRLIIALNQQPNNANILRTAIDFFIKVKDKSDAMEEEIDMEKLREIGIAIKSGD